MFVCFRQQNAGDPLTGQPIPTQYQPNPVPHHNHHYQHLQQHHQAMSLQQQLQHQQHQPQPIQKQRQLHQPETQQQPQPIQKQPQLPQQPTQPQQAHIQMHPNRISQLHMRNPGEKRWQWMMGLPQPRPANGRVFKGPKGQSWLRAKHRTTNTQMVANEGGEVGSSLPTWWLANAPISLWPIWPRAEGRAKPQHRTLPIHQKLPGSGLPTLPKASHLMAWWPELCQGLQQCCGHGPHLRGGPWAASQIQPNLSKGVLKKTCCLSSSWSFQ